eukprot:TRINITY_DN70676_c0_g1_i1.p1 TRINITY_DN70676_c0_g1~~TRINITY_DN70676_c0_g1_i1.p1  ORF type:complete len:892 (+),score=207.49 TRINITY_DN70676_c0_g1_i1:123-2798(+)
MTGSTVPEQAAACDVAISLNAGDGPVPDWMVDCDLAVCSVLKDVSAQIVANCKSFGVQLEGVCGKAVERLPADKLSADEAPAGTGGGGAEWSEACQDFLSTFGMLSKAVLELALDLESTMTNPLQTAIATLTEESVGRVKHWRMVRSQLIELQDRYGQSRKKTMEARTRLASTGGWFKKSSTEKAASQQHAALCDMAKCEEELRASEASLRKLEEESRERLRQLDRENRVLLRDLLKKGTKSLGKLRAVAGKSTLPSPPPEPASGITAGSGPEALLGVMPGGRDEATDSSDQERASRSSEPPRTVTPTPPVDIVPSSASPAPEADNQPVLSGPSAKYLQNMSSLRNVDAEFQELRELGELSDDDFEEDASVRALNWSPASLGVKAEASPSAPSKPASAPKRRNSSLVFHSSASTLVPRSSLEQSPQQQRTRQPSPKANSVPLTSVDVSPLLHRVAASAATAIDTGSGGIQSSPVRRPPTGAFGMPATGSSPAPAAGQQQGGGAEGDASKTTASTAASAAASPTSSTQQQATAASAEADVTTTVSSAPAAAAASSKPRDAAVPLASSASPGLLKAPASSSSSTLTPYRRAVVANKATIDDDDSDEDTSPATSSRAKPASAPLVEAEVPLELLPLLAGDPRKAFEKYVKRLPERQHSTTEYRWDKLQVRAAEQLCGGHVGKLELFWIVRQGCQATAETAEGLVAFQFVQGIASNFARVLHLSVVGEGNDKEGSVTFDETWQDVMPSAIFEVRKLLFGTLPISGIRAFMLAGEDDEGQIYIDKDVEVAYQRSSFRWFQLTQTLKRTKSALTGRKSVRPAARFLVLHAPRTASDPAAPRGHHIGSMPALLLRDEGGEASLLPPSSGGGGAAVANGQSQEASPEGKEEVFTGFSSF